MAHYYLKKNIKEILNLNNVEKREILEAAKTLAKNRYVG